MVNYLCYVFYPPLYLAGPVSTYNNFASQIVAQRTTPYTQVLASGLRLSSIFLLQEFLTHYIYANSISKFKLWKTFEKDRQLRIGALEFGVIAFWVLIFIWMKV